VTPVDHRAAVGADGGALGGHSDGWGIGEVALVSLVEGDD
jgi:hypothetical protein